MKIQHLSDRHNANVNIGDLRKLHSDLLGFLTWINDKLQRQNLDTTAWHSFGVAQRLTPQRWIRFDLIAPYLERVPRELANARNGLNGLHSFMQRRAVMGNNDRISYGLEVEHSMSVVREYILRAAREIEIALSRAEMGCLC